MAYRSRLFDTDRRKQEAATAGGAAPDAAAGTAALSAAPGQEPGGVGGIQAFFDANKGAGDRMLAQMAGGLSDRFSEIGDQARGTVSTTTERGPDVPGSGQPGWTSQPDYSQGRNPPQVDPRTTSTPGASTTTFNVDEGRLGDAEASLAGASDEARALTGGDLSGLSSLLPQSGSQMGRRLDAWLMQGADPTRYSRSLGQAQAGAQSQIDRARGLVGTQSAPGRNPRPTARRG